MENWLSQLCIDWPISCVKIAIKAIYHGLFSVIIQHVLMFLNFGKDFDI